MAAFPRPVFGRIPNFKGAEEACRNLVSLSAFAEAAVVKINPDAPQRPCREAALAAGKTLVMPTPRIREGFLLLDPALMPKSAFRGSVYNRRGLQVGQAREALGSTPR